MLWRKSARGDVGHGISTMTRTSIVALGAALLVSCNTTPPPPDAGVTDVSIANFTFTPKTVTIKQGESVRWTNNQTGLVNHTTTSGNPGDQDAGSLWDSGPLAPGETFTHQFNDVGTFSYFCDIHEDMASMRDAKVIVEAP